MKKKELKYDTENQTFYYKEIKPKEEEPVDPNLKRYFVTYTTQEMYYVPPNANINIVRYHKQYIMAYSKADLLHRIFEKTGSGYPVLIIEIPN